MTAIPPLPDTERLTTYSGLSTDTGPFDVAFALYGNGTDYANWIEVWLDGVLLEAGTDYTLDSPSGPLSLLARPITNARITPAGAYEVGGFTGELLIVGMDRPRRTAQLTENRGVTARDFNQFASQMTARGREAWDAMRRTVRTPPGETMDILPAAADRALTYAKFDATGQLVPGADADDLEAGAIAAAGYAEAAKDYRDEAQVAAGEAVDAKEEAEAAANQASIGGAISIPYIVDAASQTDSDPGNGKIRFNQAVQNTATVWFLDLVDGDGATRTALIDDLDSSSSTVKGAFRLTKVGDTTTYQTANFSARTTASGYRKFTIQVLESFKAGLSDASPFTDGDEVILTATKTGGKGADGLGSGDMAKATYDPDEDGKIDSGALANNAVTDAILRDSAGVSVIGRSANSTGDPADIVAGSNGGILSRLSNAVGFNTLSALLDAAIGSTRGMIAKRGASAWESLSVGSANQVLKSDGTDPGWGTVTSLLDAVIGSTRGMIAKRGSSAWESLSVGSANQVLKSDGTDPSWSGLSALLDGALGSTRGMTLRRGASAWEALALGSNGQVLTSDGADAKWGAAAGGGATIHGTCNGRLSLTTNVFVMGEAVSGATSVYFVPRAIGDQIGLHDGSSTWTMRSFTEKSVKLTDSQSCTTTNGNATITVEDSSQLVVGMEVTGTGVQANSVISSITDATTVVLDKTANSSGTNTLTFKCPADKGYDVYGKDVSNALKLFLKPRSAILTKNTHTFQDGVEVLSGDTTMRWLGAVITSATAGQADWAVSGQRRFRVFNAYNKRFIPHTEAFSSSGTYYKPMGLVRALAKIYGSSGGSRGTSSDGGTGGTTSFGSLLSVAGSTGGTNSAGGTAGAATNADLSVAGNSGGCQNSDTGNAGGAWGGPGGRGAPAGGHIHYANSLWGGCGGTYAERKLMPSQIGATESVTVGAGGGAGAGGSGGRAGGSGTVLVDELIEI